MGSANRPSRRSGKSRRAIRSVDAGVHRFDTYDEYKRVRMCASKIRYETATGDLKGTLIARSWEGGALCAYVSCGESLYRVPVWRGSDPYKRCVSMPLGSMVAMHVKAPAHGRPYCTSVEPIANRDDVPNEGGAYAHQCR